MFLRGGETVLSGKPPRMDGFTPQQVWKMFFLCEPCANHCYGLHKAQALCKRSFVANFMAPCSGLIQLNFM